MNSSTKFTIIIYTFLQLLFNGTSQGTTLPPESQTVAPPFRPSLTVVIGILGVMFTLTFLLVAYAKFFHRTQPHHLLNPIDHPAVLRSRSQLSGIDRTAIESLPFFRFSSLRGSKDGLECVVCLSKFEDSEVLRLLPKCKHAFHQNCIDKWLEKHSSCPLCRYKFESADLTNFTYSNSLRFIGNTSDLTRDLNIDLFVERENDVDIEAGEKQDQHITEDPKIVHRIDMKQERGITENPNLLHKFKHKIIISDMVFNHRWSDVNSSDLMSLNSDMLNDASSKRFSQVDSDSGRFKASVTRVKEDIEKKRLYEFKFTRSRSQQKLTRNSSSASSSTQHEVNINTTTSRLLDSEERRSKSEITDRQRFPEFSTLRNVFMEGGDRREERMRRVWLPIAKRTVQWFKGRGGNHSHV